MHELVYLRLLPTDPHAAAFRKGQGDAVFNRSRMYAQALVQRVMFFAPDVWNRVEREAETHGLDLLYLWWLLLYGKQRWSLPPRLKYALRGALAVFLLQEQNALGRYVGGRYAPLFGLVPLERPEQRYYDVTRQPLEYYEDKYDAQGKGGRLPPGVEAPENSFSGQEAVSALARWADIEFRRTLVNYVATAEATAAKDVSKLYGALYGTPLDPPSGPPPLAVGLAGRRHGQEPLAVEGPPRDGPLAAVALRLVVPPHAVLARVGGLEGRPKRVGVPVDRSEHDPRIEVHL
jgi:hypothetical protein